MTPARRPTSAALVCLLAARALLGAGAATALSRLAPAALRQGQAAAPGEAPSLVQVVASPGRRHVTELPMAQMSALLGSGGLAADASLSPDEINVSAAQYVNAAGAALANLSESNADLTAVKQAADAKYDEVERREAHLVQDFSPVRTRLGQMLQDAATEAAKGELRVLLERMSRLHYDQVAALDRASMLWEERVRSERQGAQLAEARAKFEQDAMAAQLNQSAINLQRISGRRTQEKSNLVQWLHSLDIALRGLEAAPSPA